jgi:hypothetical protein
VRVYVSGPISGRPREQYRLEFATAAAVLAANGHIPCNPTTQNGLPPGLPWESYMRADIGLLTSCDAICMLPGWQASRGASIEHDLALKLGLPVMRLDHHNRLVPRVELIGLSGYARVGKDTVAGLLGDHGYRSASFGDGQKDVLLRIDPLVGPAQPLSWLIKAEGWETAKDANSFVRPLLQRLGMAARELIADDVWITYTLRRLADGGRYVNPSVRFPNEAAAITAAGGQVWRIVRAGYGPESPHPSEISMDGYPFDVVLGNNQDLAHLRHLVDLAVKEMDSV